MEIEGEPLSQEFLNFPWQSTWTSSNKLFKLLFFYTFYSDLKCIPCGTWTSHCFHYELLSHFCAYIELHAIEGRMPFFAIFKHVIGGRMSRNINSESWTEEHVNFLQQTF